MHPPRSPPEERQPFLSEHDVPMSPVDETLEAAPPKSPETSLKVKGTGLQVIFLALFRCTPTLFPLVIAPFLNRMLVEDLHVSDEVYVGYYSGVIEASAAVGMCIGLFIFSQLSDKYGRRPVTLIGVAVSCVFSASFGFGQSFWSLTVLRFMMGLSISAQSSTVKVMISEISTLENLSQNSVYVGIGWQTGSFTAPLLGATLAKPAETWPSLFRGTVFDTYPYALPGVAAAFIPAIGVAFAAKYMVETRAFKKPDARASTSAKCHTNASAKKSGIRSLLYRPYYIIHEKLYPTNGLPPLFSCGAGYMIMIRSLLVLKAIAMQVATLLLFFASPEIGGLGLRPPQIALYLLLRPVCFVAFELACFGRMSKRAGGLIPLTRIIVWLFPLLDIVYLALAHCATSGYLNRSIIIGGLGLSLIIQTVANAAWVCCDVTTSSRAPTAEQLSTIVSFSEMTAQFALGLGTLFGSSLFAISAALDDGFLKGKLGWTIMCAFAILQALLASKLEHVDGWKEKLLERAH